MISRPERPFGISILGFLYIVIGILSAAAGVVLAFFSVLLGITIVGLIASGIAIVIATILFLASAFQLGIGIGLLRGRSWGRILAIFFAIADAILQLASLSLGNIFAVFMIVLDGTILYYMWRTHVIEYFNTG